MTLTEVLCLGSSFEATALSVVAIADAFDLATGGSDTIPRLWALRSGNSQRPEQLGSGVASIDRAVADIAVYVVEQELLVSGDWPRGIVEIMQRSELQLPEGSTWQDWLADSLGSVEYIAKGLEDLDCTWHWLAMDMVIRC